MYVRPKKSLGQHFLTDQTIAFNIAAAICSEDKSCGNSRREVLEVGPGTGVLTHYLLTRDDIRLQAVELDHESVE